MKKLLVLVVLIGCTSSKDQEILDQSMAIHEEALKIGSQVKEKIGQLESFSSNQPDSLKTILTDSVNALSAAWSSWESTIVEVPGREHEGHDHDHHDHDHEGHDHSPSPDLTPEMVLEIQQDLKSRIMLLDNRSQTVLDAFTKE